MTEILHAPGFLGTNANFAADMTLILSLIVASVFTYGAWIAKKGQRIERNFKKGSPEFAHAGKLFNLHRRVQTGGAVTNVILVLWLMILPYRDFVIRDTGGPRESFFYTITTVHALVGLFAFVFGNFVVLRGNNLMIKALKFNNYKPFMRTAYIAYMLTTLLGVGVYVTWFILIANPPLF